MSNKLRMLLSIPLLTSFSACATNTTETVRTVSDFCIISSGITYSEKKAAQTETAENKYDTAETVAQVKRHDLVYERLCQKPTEPAQ